MSFDVVKNNSINENSITTKSHYYLVVTDVNIAEQQFKVFTLLTRTNKEAPPKLIILWQSKGTL